MRACFIKWKAIKKHILKMSVKKFSQMLLKSGKVNLAHIPDDNLASSSPFVNSPPQPALGEAARSGFMKIVQVDHETFIELRRKK